MGKPGFWLLLLKCLTARKLCQFAEYTQGAQCPCLPQGFLCPTHGPGPHSSPGASMPALVCGTPSPALPQPYPACHGPCWAGPPTLLMNQPSLHPALSPWPCLAILGWVWPWFPSLPWILTPTQGTKSWPSFGLSSSTGKCPKPGTVLAAALSWLPLLDEVAPAARPCPAAPRSPWHPIPGPGNHRPWPIWCPDWLWISALLPLYMSHFFFCLLIPMVTLLYVRVWCHIRLSLSLLFTKQNSDFQVLDFIRRVFCPLLLFLFPSLTFRICHFVLALSDLQIIASFNDQSFFHSK